MLLVTVHGGVAEITCYPSRTAVEKEVEVYLHDFDNEKADPETHTKLPRKWQNVLDRGEST